MRQHNTKEEKALRRKLYNKLRQAGVPPELAHRYRNWTTNKITAIIKGIACPLDLALYKETEKS